MLIILTTCSLLNHSLDNLNFSMLMSSKGSSIKIEGTLFGLFPSIDAELIEAGARVRHTVRFKKIMIQRLSCEDTFSTAHIYLSVCTDGAPGSSNSSSWKGLAYCSDSPCGFTLCASKNEKSRVRNYWISYLSK